MATRKFKELSEPIKAHPERAERIARERSEAIAEIVDYTLGELRRARKITQDELARLMATTQPNVSRIERGGEMELSTLHYRLQRRAHLVANSWGSGLVRRTEGGCDVFTVRDTAQDVMASGSGAVLRSAGSGAGAPKGAWHDPPS